MYRESIPIHMNARKGAAEIYCNCKNSCPSSGTQISSTTVSAQSGQVQEPEALEYKLRSPGLLKSSAELQSPGKDI